MSKKAQIDPPFSEATREKIRLIAAKMKCSEEEVILRLMDSFLELIDHPEKDELGDFAKEARKILRKAKTKRL